MITATSMELPAGLLKQAEAGNAVAQFELAEYLRAEGKGRLYLATVFQWFERAATQGHLRAQNNLATMYLEGLGVPRDARRAIEWYRKAAEAGLAEAQRNLGGMHYFGNGVPRNDAEALRWIKLAAEKGDPPSIFNLGNLYYSGHGVKRDLEKAYQWQLLSTLQGNQQAANNVFVASQEMKPEEKVAAQAAARKVYRKWFEQGGASMQPSGFVMLGLLYSHKNARVVDLAEAYKWFDLAKRIGDPKASSALADLARRMKPDQIAEGKRRADELLAR